MNDDWRHYHNMEYQFWLDYKAIASYHDYHTCRIKYQNKECCNNETNIDYW